MAFNKESMKHVGRCTKQLPLTALSAPWSAGLSLFALIVHVPLFSGRSLIFCEELELDF